MDFTLTNLPDGFHDDPYPHYARLRQQSPLCAQPDGSFILSRYVDLDRVYRDTDLFRSDKRQVFGPKFGEDTDLFAHHTTSLVFNDPPLHTRVRRIIAGSLTPRALARLEPGLVELVDELLDRLGSTPDLIPDLIPDFAAAIPIEVIGNLLGVPQADRAPLRGWSLAILGALEPALTPDAHARGNAAVRDFLAYLRVLTADRRRNPGDPETDVLTRLIQSDAEGGLSEAELLHNCIFILNAGHETTTNLIGSGLALMVANPQARAQVRADPTLMPAAVDEVLRLESPNQFGNRQTTAPVVLHGVTVPAGSDLHLCIGAANRDPDVFPDPDQFRLDRKPNRHLAFAGGPHVCVGLTLARLEGRIALSRLLGRFGDLSLLPGATRSGRVRFRGYESLPARLGDQGWASDFGKG